MAKKASKSIAITVNDISINLFQDQTIDLPACDLPDGITPLEIIQIKWTEAGQSVWGQYCGHSINKSQYKDKPEYMFHRLSLPNKVIIGFCGSKQLDDALCEIDSYTNDVHIIYAGEKQLQGANKFKQFLMYVRPHPVTHVALENGIVA